MAIFNLRRRSAAAGTSRNHGSRANLLLWLLVVPIALAALGIWEIQRAGDGVASAGQGMADMQQALKQLQQMAADDPNASVMLSTSNGDQYYSALAAASVVQDDISDANFHLMVSEVLLPLAWGTVIGAIIAFLGGLVGLLAANLAGMRARSSRSQLVKSFARLRSQLPFILAVMIAGFGISAVAATLFEATNIVVWDGLSSGSGRLLVAAVILAGVSLYSAFLAIKGLRQVFGLFTPEPLDVAGRVVDEQAAPGLWRFVRGLAEKQQALLPDTIIVGLADGFYVTESAVRLWPENRMLSGRSLYLPAPYLEFLDAAEISAVIGHEFAHFAGEDTAYSQRFTPIYAGLWRALAALARSESGTFILRPAVHLGYYAMERFNLSVAHWSRIREFDADRDGSVVGGRAGAASALVRTGIIPTLVTEVLDEAFNAPDQAKSDLVAEMAARATARGFGENADSLEQRQPHPTDSHPPTIQRIEALGVTLDDAVLSHARRAPSVGLASLPQQLFADWAGFCGELTRDFITNGRRQRAERRQALETAVSAVVEETTVYDNVMPMIVVMVFLIVVLGAFAAAMIVVPQALDFGPGESNLLLAILGVAILAALAYAVVLLRRRNTPLMVLTQDTLVASRLDRPLPWTDIVDFRVFAGNRFGLRLAIKDEAPLPGKIWHALYTKVDRRRRIVTIGALGIRGMKAQKFSDLVRTYLAAAWARRELAENTPSEA